MHVRQRGLDAGSELAPVQLLERAGAVGKSKLKPSGGLAGGEISAQLNRAGKLAGCPDGLAARRDRLQRGGELDLCRLPVGQAIDRQLGKLHGYRLRLPVCGGRRHRKIRPADGDVGDVDLRRPGGGVACWRIELRDDSVVVRLAVRALGQADHRLGQTHFAELNGAADNSEQVMLDV